MKANVVSAALCGLLWASSALASAPAVTETGSFGQAVAAGVLLVGLLARGGDR